MVSNGSVAPNTSWCVENSNVVLSATPSAYYDFDHWSGNVTGTSNPITIVMTNSKTVTAYFVAEVVTNGTPKWWLATNSLPITDVGALTDTDGDGLPNWLEYAYHTNPNLADTDGDGYSDGVEVSWGSDPTDAKSVPIANMTVASSPTGIGHPQPIGYGVFSLPLGSTVTDAVSSLVYQGSGTRYQNIGWLGTGDVPSVGLTNNLRFTLNVNSSLTWLWGAQYALSIATNYSTSAKFVARDESSKWLAPDGTNDDGFWVERCR